MNGGEYGGRLILPSDAWRNRILASEAPFAVTPPFILPVRRFKYSYLMITTSLPSPLSLSFIFTAPLQLPCNTTSIASSSWSRDLAVPHGYQPVRRHIVIFVVVQIPAVPQGFLAGPFFASPSPNHQNQICCPTSADSYSTDWRTLACSHSLQRIPKGLPV